MKKFLFVTFAVMMIFSVVCSAAPCAVEVNDSPTYNGEAFSDLSEISENSEIEIDFSQMDFSNFIINYEPSIRKTGEVGIRFKAGIATKIKFEEKAFVVEEYGFIIARQDHLEQFDTELTLDFPLIAKGVAYNRADGIDIIFDDRDDEICIFTGVLKGIPEEHYETKLVCKTYTKINVGGELHIVYGEKVVASMSDFEEPDSTEKNLSDYKIVTGYELGEDEDGKWRIYYRLLDPYTGETMTSVPSKSSDSRAATVAAKAVDLGAVITLDNGEVADKTDTEHLISPKVNQKNLVWITDVDEDEETFRVVPFNAALDNKNDALIDHVDTSTDPAYSFEKNSWTEADALKSNIISYDKNTVVTIIQFSDYNATHDVVNNTVWSQKNMTLSDMSTVIDCRKEVLAYNTKLFDRDGTNRVTKYAPFVKAYVCVDETGIDLANDKFGVAKFIIVIVNDNENAAKKAAND